MQRQSGRMVVGSTLCVLAGIGLAGISVPTMDRVQADDVKVADQTGVEVSKEFKPASDATANDGLMEKQLREKVASLEAEGARLQLRVRQLEQQSPRRLYTVPPGSLYQPFILPRQPQNQKQAPPGSTPFAFNGGTYYVVPLHKALPQQVPLNQAPVASGSMVTMPMK